MDFNAEFADHQARIERGIDRLLPQADAEPRRLHEAMRYSMQAGGKRLRPVLTLAAARLFDPAGRTDPLAAAVAVECVHTYSLIHDDLPCMDNDDLRRGRPTCHKAFDEATALLAGDALLTLAFALVAASYPPPAATALIRELAAAAGSEHLIGGQMADLLAEKNPRATPADLDFIHRNKTGALIEAALAMGAIAGGAEAAHLGRLREAGRHLGLAFQIVDDILDATGDAATLGKTPGKDLAANKATFVRFHGIAASRQAAAEHTAGAVAALQALPGESGFLIALAGMMAGRAR